MLRKRCSRTNPCHKALFMSSPSCILRIFAERKNCTEGLAFNNNVDESDSWNTMSTAWLKNAVEGLKEGAK